MHYLYIIFLLLITTSSIHSMDTQTPDTTALSLPQEVWKKIACICPRKNTLRLLNKCLHTLASRSNWREIVKAATFYISRTDADNLLFEAVESGHEQESICLLNFFKQKFGIKTPSDLCNFGIPLWYYARTESMRTLLKQFGTFPGKKDCESKLRIVQAGRSGDIDLFKKELTSGLEQVSVSQEDTTWHTQFLERLSYYICQNDHAACLKLLLPHTHDSNNLLLLYAVNNGSTRCTEMLVKKANVNITESQKKTPLIYAVSNGSWYLVKLLLEHGADQMIPDTDELRPLNYALAYNYPEITELLIKHLPNTQESEDYINAAKLHHACQNGDIDTLCTALDAGHSIAPLGFVYNSNLLCSAAAQGDTPLLNLLIDRGYYVNEKFKDGLTPIFFAANANQLLAVQTLHKAGARLDCKVTVGAEKHLTLGTQAVAKNNLDMLKYFVQHGLDIKQPVNKNGMTLLHIAARNKNSESMVTYLIEQGLSINAIFKDTIEGKSLDMLPIHLACETGHLLTVKALAAAGANMMYYDATQGYPITRACVKGRTEIVQFFIEEYIKNHVTFDHTLFDEFISNAVYYGHFDTVKLLLDAGAGVSDNLIQLAGERGHITIEQLLQTVQEKRRGTS